MSAGPSLYRRHRPRSFADVVGQEHVVRTLSNAVERDRVHHAYLFVGSRGTGKTSMAKILAACLNCVQGRTVDPCGVCESCRSIAAATSLDVIEMDAASSNSVDDIRSLRESVAYAPVSGGTKVYILDEAHMLSTAAWNAFLKTLEEPPPNTVFVLATTEAQKVLPTVVDRCLRFDFHRPSAEQIAAVLRRAAQAESIEAPPEVIALLARHAQGSFRDALGTLEQLSTYSGPRLALEDALAVLGVADAELLFGTLDAVHLGDSRAALLAVARCVEGGHEPTRFVRELEAHARELLVVRTLDGAVPAELSVTPERDARLAEQAAQIDSAALVRLLDLLAAAMEALRAGSDGRTQLELALVKAASPEVDPGVQALLARIERLERAPLAAPTPAVPPPVPNAPSPSTSESSVPSPPGPEASPADAPAPPTLEQMRAIWPAVLEHVGSENGFLAAVITHARPVVLEQRRLVLAFDEDAAFLRRRAEDRENRAAVLEAVAAVSGHALSIEYELRALEQGATSPSAAPLSEDEWVARLKSEFGAHELGIHPTATKEER
ncbi:MAG: DNA polymerase III subunit gamma/tau [Solirubrobacteraceae bacterium]